jgi:hypothetical protein
VIATIANLSIVIETIYTTIVLAVMTRTQRAASLMNRRMIASTITSRKRATRPCIMTSPLCQAWAIGPGEAVEDLLCTLVLGLALAQAAGTAIITMWLRMTASRARSPSMGTCTPPSVMMGDVSIALTRAILFLLPSPLQWKRTVSAPRNRESHQQRIHESYRMSSFQIMN